MGSASFIVDTRPMANEIVGIANHVNATTAAVAVMETAVIQAEEAAAEQICQNVNRGFHRLIRSQISQKKILAQAEAGSKLIELRRFALSLRKIREQLHSDFQRITSRYARLFRSLDDSLAARIFRLDGEAFTLAEKQIPQITSRIATLGTPLVVSHGEVRDTSDALVVARVKRDTVALMSGVQSYIQRSNALKTAVSEMVQTTGALNLTWFYVPALIIESEDVYMPASKVNNIIVGTAAGGRCSELIRKKIDETQGTFAWQAPSEKDLDGVKQLYRKRVNSEISDKRVADYMQTLINKPSWRVLKEAS